MPRTMRERRKTACTARQSLCKPQEKGLENLFSPATIVSEKSAEIKKNVKRIHE